jgi:hypothetical protein
MNIFATIDYSFIGFHQYAGRLEQMIAAIDVIAESLIRRA